MKKYCSSWLKLYVCIVSENQTRIMWGFQEVVASSNIGSPSLACSEDEFGAVSITAGVRTYEVDGYNVYIARFSAHIEKELVEGRPFHVWSNMIIELANGIMGSRDIKYDMHCTLWRSVVRFYSTETDPYVQDASYILFSEISLKIS